MVQNCLLPRPQASWRRGQMQSLADFSHFKAKKLRSAALLGLQWHTLPLPKLRIKLENVTWPFPFLLFFFKFKSFY